MKREKKFKGKLQNYYGVIDNDWITFELFDIFNYNDSLSKTIVTEPLCQLITKIGDVEIYEYDCYYDKKKRRIYYFYYDKSGYRYLRVFVFDKEQMSIQQKYKTINQESTYDISLQIRANYNIQFIGNWHDGEEYLLNKIKEVENE